MAADVAVDLAVELVEVAERLLARRDRLGALVQLLDEADILSRTLAAHPQVVDQRPAARIGFDRLVAFRRLEIAREEPADRPAVHPEHRAAARIVLVADDHAAVVLQPGRGEHFGQPFLRPARHEHAGVGQQHVVRVLVQQDDLRRKILDLERQPFGHHGIGALGRDVVESGDHAGLVAHRVLHLVEPCDVIDRDRNGLLRAEDMAQRRIEPFELERACAQVALGHVGDHGEVFGLCLEPFGMRRRGRYQTQRHQQRADAALQIQYHGCSPTRPRRLLSARAEGWQVTTDTGFGEPSGVCRCRRLRRSPCRSASARASATSRRRTRPGPATRAGCGRCRR